MRCFKEFLIKYANPLSLVGSAEHKIQCEHFLEDMMQSLRDGNGINERTTNDDDSLDHSAMLSNMSYEDVSDEISRFFDF